VKNKSYVVLDDMKKAEAEKCRRMFIYVGAVLENLAFPVVCLRVHGK